MANFNPTTGKWTDSGGGEHNSRVQAQMRGNMMDSSSGGGFADGILGALWKFFCLIPRLLGVVIGGLCGFILKLGIVGKVAMSALAAAGALIILGVIANGVDFIDPKSIIVGIIIIALALSVGVWFWLWHYDVVKKIPYRHFVALTTQCMLICFWGPIIYYLFFSVLKLFNAIKEIPIGFFGAVGIALAGAIVYWLVKANAYKTLDYDMEEPEPLSTPLPSNDKRYSPGDLIWARWSEDGNLYLAGIADSSATGVRVVFYDGADEEVSKEDIFYLDEVQDSGLTPYGNWKGKGTFYPCNILELRENSVLVRYTEDKVKEELPYHGLVFMN